MLILNKERQKRSKELFAELKEIKSTPHEYIKQLDDQGMIDELFYAFSKKIFFTKDDVGVVKAISDLELGHERGCLFNFFVHSVDVSEKHQNALCSFLKQISYEDLFSYLELSLFRLKFKYTDYDGIIRSQDIATSMHESLLSTISWLILTLRDVEPESGNKKKKTKRNAIGRKITRAACYIKTISYELSELFKGDYKALSKNEFQEKFGISSDYISGVKFFLELTNKDWRDIETYRDLNYHYFSDNEDDFSSIIDYGIKSGFIKSRSPDLMHFDFGRTKEFYWEVASAKAKSAIMVLYGDLSLKFKYKEEIFSIEDLFDVSKKMEVLACQLIDANKYNFEKNTNLVFSGSANDIQQKLGVSKKFSKLIELFCYDVHDKRSVLKTDAPLIKIGCKIYFLPSRVYDVHVQKIIDKILSSSSVEVGFPKGIQKGHLLEEYLIYRLSDAGYSISSIKRDSGKNVPEIDGVLKFGDNYLVVYEAKSSILPEERNEAQLFLDNHVSKALEQLDKRVLFLREHPDLASARLGYSIDGMEIFPMIVSNVHYFSGCRFISPRGMDVSFIDVNTFLSIMCDSKINSWQSVGPKEYYSYVNNPKYIHEANDKINAIKKPYQYLMSSHNSTIQVLDHGVAFEISKEVSIL